MYNDSLVDTIVKLNNQTAGRDRIIRLLQYGSRFLWWHTQRLKRDRNLVVRIQDVEYSLSTGRKLFRLGRFIDTLYVALKTLSYPDATIRSTLTLSKISHALYLLTDHILWIGRMGILNVDKSKWTTRSNQFWLLSIVFALIRDLYEISIILEHRTKSSNKCSSTSMFLSTLIKNHKSVAMDTLKNGCDLFLPLTSLGYVKFNAGTVGLLGVISSFVGILTLIDSTMKLQPS